MLYLVISNIRAKHKLNMCFRYIRDLLLNPPVFEIASAIQGKHTISKYLFVALLSVHLCVPDVINGLLCGFIKTSADVFLILLLFFFADACRIMSNVTCSIPDFTCISAAKVHVHL